MRRCICYKNMNVLFLVRVTEMPHKRYKDPVLVESKLQTFLVFRNYI